MTNVSHQLSRTVAVMDGKDDFIRPGKHNQHKFPVSVSVEPSARTNECIVLRQHALQFPRMILCFDLSSFHFCSFSYPLLVSFLFVFLLIVPCFTSHCLSSARIFHSFGEGGEALLQTRQQDRLV
jgi:hypothetical protein